IFDAPMSIREAAERRPGMDTVATKADHGEAKRALHAFATLGLIVAAQTTLETARDAIFMTKLPASQLNVVYVIIAALTPFAPPAQKRFAARLGTRNALIGSLIVAALLTMLLAALAPSARGALALYTLSGVVGAVIVPQVWLLNGQLFTASEGERL